MKDILFLTVSMHKVNLYSTSANVLNAYDLIQTRHLSPRRRYIQKRSQDQDISDRHYVSGTQHLCFDEVFVFYYITTQTK